MMAPRDSVWGIPLVPPSALPPWIVLRQCLASSQVSPRAVAAVKYTERIYAAMED